MHILKKTVFVILGILLISTLIACVKSVRSAQGLEVPGTESTQRGAPNQLPQPVRPTISVPPPPLTTSLRTGEQAEFQRRIMRQDNQASTVLPEDYAAGPLLTLSSNEKLPGKKAISVIQNYFTALSKAEAIDQYCTPTAQRYSQTIFDPLKDKLTEIKTIRFLSSHHIDDSEAAFDLRLMTPDANARAQFYLSWNKGEKKWFISDIQGNVSTLSQAAETGYTDYEPTAIERQLIREGHIK